MDAREAEKLHDNSTGMGAISKGTRQSNLMTLTPGQWIGEECAFEEMPLVYSAIAKSDLVRVLRVTIPNLQKFLSKVDQEHVKKYMWAKLKFMRERVMLHHETREELLQQCSGTKDLGEQMKHVNKIMPNSNFRIRK